MVSTEAARRVPLQLAIAGAACILGIEMVERFAGPLDCGDPNATFVTWLQWAALIFGVAAMIVGFIDPFGRGARPVWISVVGIASGLVVIILLVAPSLWWDFPQLGRADCGVSIA